jgi:hypothetical protein
VISAPLTAVAQPGITDWLTAVGTVAVAIVAATVAVVAERRADKRVRDERTHSDQVLAEEQVTVDQSGSLSRNPVLHEPSSSPHNCPAPGRGAVTITETPIRASGTVNRPSGMDAGSMLW